MKKLRCALLAVTLMGSNLGAADTSANPPPPEAHAKKSDDLENQKKPFGSKNCCCSWRLTITTGMVMAWMGISGYLAWRAQIGNPIRASNLPTVDDLSHSYAFSPISKKPWRPGDDGPPTDD